jgi:hypothetical protein
MMMREQINSSQRTIDALTKELRDLRDQISRPAPKTEDATFREKMLDKLIDGDSARVMAIRTQMESELRQVKENHREDERRWQDRMDREIAALRATAERELASMKSSHEITLQTVRSSASVEVSAAKSSFDTQLAVAKSENDRLRAENTELKLEVKELRLKKEKGPIELLKEVKLLKEAMGEDDEEPAGVGAQIVEAVSNPATWEGIGSIVGRIRGPEQPQQQAPAQQPEGNRKRRVVRLPDGTKMILEGDGRTLSPIPPKPQVAAGDGKPAEPQMPSVDPETVSLIVGFLERAFEGGQDPAVVAQGARSRVPEEMVTAIRDHGVDAVMTKMAKLSSTSPLSSQRGRVWVRALGEALVG